MTAAPLVVYLPFERMIMLRAVAHSTASINFRMVVRDIYIEKYTGRGGLGQLPSSEVYDVLRLKFRAGELNIESSLARSPSVPIRKGLLPAHVTVAGHA